MSVTSEERLILKLENSKAYREAYVREHVKTSMPVQIRHLREQRELTQAQLAALAKSTQTVISRLEDPNYGNLTINSLLKIADALDIGLLVKLVPFSRLLAEFQDLSPKALAAASFTAELPLLKYLAISATRTKNVFTGINTEHEITKPATICTTGPTSSMADVEQWGKIQTQIPDMQTANAHLTIPWRQHVSRAVSGATIAFIHTRTTDFALSGENKISINLIDLGIGVLDSHMLPLGHIELSGLEQERISYGRYASRRVVVRES